jgi:hypothetical protein
MNHQEDQSTKMMTRQQVTGYILKKYGIHLSPLTLEKYSCQGGGPRFHRFGTRRVYYFPADVDLWVKTRLGRQLRSTSDKGLEVSL